MFKVGKMTLNFELSRVNKITIKKLLKNCLSGSGIKMISFSIEELKTIAKLRKVKDYKYKSKDELIKIPNEPEPKIEELEKNLMNQEINFLSQK